MRLCALQGARQHAALHLRWSDISFETQEIRWRAEWDKVGNEVVQPLRERSRLALALVRAPWAEPTVEWVCAAAQGRTVAYPKASFGAALRRAEIMVGVEHRPRRAARGFRRRLAGEVAHLTGSTKLAMEAIGDWDIRMADRYVKRRQGALLEAFDQLDAELAGRDPRSHPNTVQTAPKSATLRARKSRVVKTT